MANVAAADHVRLITKAVVRGDLNYLKRDGDDFDEILNDTGNSVSDTCYIGDVFFTIMMLPVMVMLPLILTLSYFIKMFQEMKM